MAKSHLIRSIQDLSGRLASDFEVRIEPTEALLCPPTYFDVIDVKNPHMKGNIGRVNSERAERQWQQVREAIVKTKTMIRILEPEEGLEDMVFTANPTLPGLGKNGEKICLLSNMTHPSRKKEVGAHEKWFAKRGYKIARLSKAQWRFEGQGDALWHPKRRLIWGGYGFRTVPEAYEEIGTLFSCPVVLLHLKLESLYHLDTCFSPLSETDALFYPKAFDENGVELIRALYPRAMEVPEEEAIGGFACNPLVIGKNVLIQKGNRKTNAVLEKLGYEPIELDTSEYMKSGGSVFCMKMMVYS